MSAQADVGSRESGGVDLDGERAPIPGHGEIRRSVRLAVASELGLSEEDLPDEASIETIGLDSLGLAQVVVAVEEVLGGEVDGVLLSERLAFDTTIGELIEVLAEGLLVQRGGESGSSGDAT